VALFDLAGIKAIGRGVVAQAREGADAYQVIRPVRTNDDAGGWTEADSVVESGECFLIPGATRPEEKAIADRAQSTTPYVLRALPFNTILTADDTVRIAGREFSVLGVLRAEAANVAVTAVAEERV
jgi:hypothetical protein